MVDNASPSSVLLVVDAQVGVMNDTWEPQRIVANIASCVKRARHQGVPVIWVQHADEELIQDSSEWQLVPELIPLSSEIRVYKHFNSAFEKTRLHEILTTLGANHVFLVGAATNWCIRATAYGALDRHYDLTLIEDAHTTASIEFDDGRKIEAEQIIQELNLAMKWVSYPDRANDTTLTAHVNFV